MCFGVPHPLLAQRTGSFSFAPAPNCHLLLTIGDIASRRHELIDALLRVDLGARIQADPASGHVSMEGRFRKADALLAIRQLGFSVAHVEERTDRDGRSGRGD